MFMDNFEIYVLFISLLYQGYTNTTVGSVPASIRTIAPNGCKVHEIYFCHVKKLENYYNIMHQ